MKFHLPRFLTTKWLLLVFWTSFWLVSTASKTSSQIPESTNKLTLKSTIQSYFFELVQSNLFLILLVAWLGGSLGLTWCMRQTALQSKNPDKTAIWYSYQRFFQWLVGGIWLGWLGMMFLGDGKQWINAYFAQSIGYQTIINLCGYFLPPAIVIVIGYALSHAVFANVRGIEWTKKNLSSKEFLLKWCTFSL